VGKYYGGNSYKSWYICVIWTLFHTPAKRWVRERAFYRHDRSTFSLWYGHSKHSVPSDGIITGRYRKGVLTEDDIVEIPSGIEIQVESLK